MRSTLSKSTCVFAIIFSFAGTPLFARSSQNSAKIENKYEAEACQKQSPTNFADNLGASPQIIGENEDVPPYISVRNLPIETLKKKYSYFDLKCWAQRDDQIALLMLSYFYIRRASGLEDFDKAKSLLERAAIGKRYRTCQTDLNDKHVSSNICIVEMSKNHFECPCGLPEAQYRLSIIDILSSGRSNPQDIDLLIHAAQGGYYSKALGAQSCIHDFGDQFNALSTCLKNLDQSVGDR